ncbi:MAG: hypothetical protein M1830_009413 [Pleopsidium flavum]|nr:MAG: hypothetical protein M1830_009413 [Pleopsidium flavum]
MTARTVKRPTISKPRRKARPSTSSLLVHLRNNPSLVPTFQSRGHAAPPQTSQRSLDMDTGHVNSSGVYGGQQNPAELLVAQGQDLNDSSELDRVSQAMNILTLDREEVHRANNGLPSEDELRALQDPHALLFEAVNTALSALKKLGKGRKLHNRLGLATPTYVGTDSGLPSQMVGMVGRPSMACEPIEGLYESAIAEGKEAAMMLGMAAQWIDGEKAQVRDSIMMRRVTF